MYVSARAFRYSVHQSSRYSAATARRVVIKRGEAPTIKPVLWRPRSVDMSGGTQSLWQKTCEK